MKKFGGPGPGPYEKNTGIGEIPAAGPCDVKGLNKGSKLELTWFILHSCRSKVGMYFSLNKRLLHTANKRYASESMIITLP